MGTADASGSRVRLPALVAVGLGLVFASSSCDGTQDSSPDPAVIGAQGGQEQGQLQRLDAVEYDQAVQRTLGVSPSLTNDERLTLLGHAREVTPAEYEQHVLRIDQLLDHVFASDSLRSRIVTCQPAFQGDAGCVQAIVREMGARAWQRPLDATEVEQLTALATSATSLGVTFPQSIQHVVKTLMISAPFLYRVQGV
jgi:hypothetical protein